MVEVPWARPGSGFKGVGQSLPNASITFDKFHLKKIITDAVDRTRRAERHDHPELAIQSGVGGAPDGDAGPSPLRAQGKLA
jgi:hypothetical protein